MDRNREGWPVAGLSVFLLAFVPRALLCLKMTPIGVFSDELATISGGAYFAGYDWSSVVSHAGYYGTGFTAFTAPLFWLTDNPVVIYIGIGLLCTLVQSLTGLIALSLFRKFFGIRDLRLLVLFSVVCSYMVTSRTIIVFNEHPLILASWILAWLIAKLYESQEDRKKKAGYTALVVLVLGYSLTLHTRALTFWLAFGIAVLYYAWVYRRCLISLPTALAGGVFAWWAAGRYTDFVKLQIWGTAEGLRNGDISFGGSVTDLLNPENWQAWFNIILGQIHTVGVLTGGMFILFFVVFTHVLWKALVRKKDIAELEEDNAGRRAFPIMVFCMAGIFMTILGQSISWLGGSIEVIHTGFDNDLYATKAYGYLRYFGPYCGPFLMVCLVYIDRFRELVVRYLKPALAALLVCEAYWMIDVLPYIYHSSQIGVFEFYVPFSLWPLEEEMRFLALLPASIVMFAMFLICWAGLKKQKQWIYILLVGVILVHSYFYIGMVWELDFMEGNYEMCDGGYEAIKQAEEGADLPEKIYVADERWWETDHMTYYGYQMLLNRYQIVPWEEGIEAEEEEAVTITNMVYTEDEYRKWKELGYAYCLVDEDELLLVKGQKLQEAFRTAGINLQE